MSDQDKLISGVAGGAQRITAPSLRPDQEASIASWLVNCPGQALWSDYLVCVIHLRELPGVAPAHKSDPTATHEIIVCALDPKHQPRPDDLQSIHHLTPVNYLQQFEVASDEQAIGICERLVEAFVDGQYRIEPFGPTADRNLVHEVIRTTAEHVRTGRHQAERRN